MGSRAGSGELEPRDISYQWAGWRRLAGVPGWATGQSLTAIAAYRSQTPESFQHLVRHLIYPVPDPNFPFLGVHFTRLIHGGIEAGPNAVLALRREGYRKTDFSLRDSLDALLFPGLWKFMRRYPGMCWWEIKRSLSRDLFCQSLQRLAPAIQPEDLSPGGADRAGAIAGRRLRRHADIWNAGWGS